VEERFLYRGDGEGVLVHGEKKGGYRGSAGEGLIPYMTIFCYWGGDREAAEVALKILSLSQSGGHIRLPALVPG
jgi:hypothetical protein